MDKTPDVRENKEGVLLVFFILELEVGKEPEFASRPLVGSLFDCAVDFVG